MYYLTALLAAFAVATPSLQAAPLPARSDIFNSVTYSRPAISASGQWLASTAVSDGKLHLFPMAGGAGRRISLPEGTRGNYYRWASGPKDVLIIDANGASGPAIFRFDADSATLSSVTGTDYTQTFAYGVHTNNYAFTYLRFRKGEIEYDLGPGGEMVPVAESGEHLPGYLADGKRYLHIAPGQNEWTFLGGADAAARGTVMVRTSDTRRAGGLVSVSSDGRAWFLSSHGADTLRLISLDTASGERKTVATAPNDISKVILNPLTMAPDFVDYETDRPQRQVFNPAVAPDLTLLGSNGNGFPTILDRSPNDRYWVVSYVHRDGTPRMLGFDRTTKRTMPLPPQAFTYIDSSDMRVRPFSIGRPDGVQISGHVTLPRAGVCERRRCPVVLLVHGGPAIRDLAAYTADRFWLTSRGIAVVDVNYRGSSGYGEQFQQMDARQWAGAIPQDVNAALAHALAEFPLDRSRVAGMGTSFGGYLTLHLAATGTQMRCAVIDSASTDIVKFADRQFGKYGEGSDILQRVGDTRIAADKDAMTRMSPSSHVNTLKSMPLLHLHGARDDITYLDDNQAFADAMLAANPHYTFVGMPDAGHGLYPGRTQFYALAEAFLGKCLGVKTEPVSAQEAAPFSAYQIKGERSFMQP
ncbi:MAG TPA: prolyl oligopeptidase family serine peptidase [Telluria sp.]